MIDAQAILSELARVKVTFQLRTLATIMGVPPTNQENPMSDRIHAPFDDEQREALRAWQDCGWAHPLTCGACNIALPMIPEKRGLVCPLCFHVQEDVPAMCLTLPENPASILAAQAKPEADNAEG